MLGRKSPQNLICFGVLLSVFIFGTVIKAFAGSPPSISVIANQRTFHSKPTQPIAFTIVSTNAFTVSALSSNTVLVPATNLVLAGSGSNWTLIVIPATNSLGTATISVLASNQFGLATNSFVLTVADFSDVTSNLPAAFGGTVNWVDYDNDGYLDLFLCGTDTNYNAHTWLFHNNHDGTFTEVATPFPNVSGPSADWADFDGDGYLDLAITLGPYAQVYRNLGGTNFVLAATLSPSTSGGSVTWCDLDNDGKPDIVISGGNYTMLYHNNGDGTFAFISTFSGAPAAVADYDNDGWNDIFIIGNSLNGMFPLLYRNVGNNSFTNSGMSFPACYGGMGAWGDYNNDGYPDLLLDAHADTGDGTNILYKNNAGTLTQLPGIDQLRDGMVAWGDFDNDGYLDFFDAGLVVGCCYQSKIYQNGGTNNSFTDIGFAMPGLYQGAAAWGDFDNDGALDLVYMGENGNTLMTKLFHNDGAMPDHPPTAPTGLNVTRGPNSALLSWIASTDPDQSGGLTYNVRIGTASGAVNVVSPNSDLVTGFRRVPKFGNAGYRTSYLITNLPPGTFYWSVQAVDNAFKGSPFSSEQSFNLPAPAITNQPQSLTVLAGAQVVFQVGATGAPPLFYQWSLNDTNLNGATNSTLTLNNVQNTNSGAYAVTVTNTWGAITSSNAVLIVNTPPMILAQPQGATVIEGQSVSFLVSATGDAPLSYQWSFDGTNLAGATNSVFSLSSVVPSEAGAYTVSITNFSGSTNSVPAVLSIPPSLPLILVQPQSQYAPAGLGVNASFSVSAIGTTPLSYQWRFNGAAISGATLPSLTLTNIQSTNAGPYSVLISNSVGPTLSQDAILSITAGAGSTNQFIASGNVVDFVYDDSRDVLYLINGGSGIQRYQPGSASFLAPFAISGSLINLDLSPDGRFLAVADHTVGANAWIYLVDLTSNTIRQPILTNFPGYVNSLAFGSDGALICEASNLVARYDPLTDIATRRNTVGDGNGPMSASGDRSTIAIAGPGDSAGLVFTYNVTNQGIDGFVWSADYITQPPELNRFGNLFAEPTSYGLPIFTNQHINDYSGNYIALIPSPSGVVFCPTADLLFCGKSGTRELHAYETRGFTESFVLDFKTNIINSRMRTSRDGSKIFGGVANGVNWIAWTNVPPSFAAQPSNQFVLAGSNTTMSARVFGSAYVQYQWQAQGVSIPNATNASLNISGQPFHTASSNYTVITYNPYGFMISTNALLTIVSPPYGIVSPSNQTTGAGSKVTFTVTSDGSLPFAYQWRFNGTNIAGATNSAFLIDDPQATNAGNYTVVITNNYGRATSSVAMLTVTPASPWVFLQPVPQTTYVSSNVTIAAIGRGSEPLSYQWFNSNAIANSGRFNGANTTNLNIANAQPGDATNYYVVITNSYGAITSSFAALTVIIIPPGITVSPVGRSVPQGLPTVFTAVASGSPPLHYQWQLNGTNIPNATSASYSISGVNTTNLGSYHVIVTNFYGAGTVTSTDAVLTLGNVAAWGLNSSNECFPPPNLTNAFAVAGSLGASFAARTDGSVIGWGGGGATAVPPQATNVVALASAAGTIALRADGSIVGWNGINVPVTSNIVAVAEGNNFGLALRAEGTLVAWGNSPYTNFPNGLTNVIAVACGTTHSLALGSDGKILSWGTGSVTNVPASATNVTAIAAGYNFSLARKADGTVAAWGIGVGTNLPAGLTNVAAIFAGGDAQGAAWGQAIGSNGTFLVWGNNSNGETNPPSALTNFASAGAAPASYHGLDIISDGRPLIVHPPVGLIAYVGRNVKLHADVVGTAPLIYQWLLNGTNLPGATNSSLSLANVQPAIAGNYQLIVSNALGVATSLAAPLAVLNPPPAIFTSDPGFGWRSNTFAFNAQALPGQVVVIEATADFVVWTPIQTNVAVGGDLIVPTPAFVPFMDPQAGSFPRRFYRARLFQGALPAPAIISSGAFGIQSNTFGFGLSCVPGQNIVVDASTNLITWTPLATNTLTNVPFYFVDPAADFGCRFYRARVQ